MLQVAASQPWGGARSSERDAPMQTHGLGFVVVAADSSEMVQPGGFDAFAEATPQVASSLYPIVDPYLYPDRLRLPSPRTPTEP